jgi:ParB family chromosome partitioning protein
MSRFDLNSFIGTPDIMKNAVQNIDIDKLVPYKDHCFRLYEGERLDDMVRSVQQYGIMVPIIVRNVPGSDTYEILSGHNRVNAARIAGKKNVPALVKENLPDEFAEVYVIETNLLQRGFKELKISEQAFAVAVRYKKLFDQKKIQAISDELQILQHDKSCSRPPVGDGSGKRMETIAAEEYGIGHSTVARLLRINELSKELKAMADDGNIKIRPAVELSYIPKEMQVLLVNLMSEQEVSVIDMKMAKQMREIAGSYASPSEELIAEVLCGTYGEDAKPKEAGEKVTIPKATYSRYLGGYSKKEANLIIEKALAYYFEKNEEETA